MPSDGGLFVAGTEPPQGLQTAEERPMAAFVAFLHHVCAFTVFAALFAELMLIRGTLTVENARKILRADMIYGIAAGALLLVGLARVFHFEKGAYYYFHTWTFIAKLSLFLIVGLISIVPTREFLRWRSALQAGQAPVVSPEKMKSVRSIIHYELTGLVLIMLFAALMAKGIGLLL
jgi:putative membrane protein